MIFCKLQKNSSWIAALVILSVWFCLGGQVSAQVSNSLPVATTVGLNGGATRAGEVVVYDEVQESYKVSQFADDPGAFGVIATDPALVFVTDAAAIPVVTTGVTSVLVNTEGGDISRGDLLTTSFESGVATRATVDDDHVFAVALESYRSVGSQVGTILAEVNRERATSLLIERRSIEEEVAAEEAEAGGVVGADGEGETDPFTILRQGDVMGAIKAASPYIRGIIATIIAVGALFFVLYAFRSNIANATLSVGRNPRARNAIMAVSFGNLLFAIVLALLAIFVAIAVLVLPV